MSKHVNAIRAPIERLASRRAIAQNPGLLLNRMLARGVGDDERDREEKQEVLTAACAAARDATLRKVYQLAFDRWYTDLPQPNATSEVETPPHSRIIVGLGNKGVIEAGLRLHHTYGMPIIPGSALKGITSHYCHAVWGPKDERYRQRKLFHTLLFGTTEDAGVLRFDDAWMVPSPDGGLLPDVMTPHHQQWQTEKDVAPTDFDSPVPVPFVSVAGRFRIVVCWQGPEHPQAKAWTERGLLILTEALREWGIGGKTTSGYGRLVETSGKVAGPVTSAPRPASPPKKRDANTPARVTIVGPRPKGGYDVQEEGRAAGTLTLGTPPANANTDIGSVVDVLVHVDDPRKPQYKWPAAKR